jgi:hypothetical protein
MGYYVASTPWLYLLFFAAGISVIALPRSVNLVPAIGGSRPAIKREHYGNFRVAFTAMIPGDV